MQLPSHKTKIVCTIGPASEDLSTIKDLMKAGLNIVRLNFSHGDFKTHAQVIRRVRKAAKELKKRVALMADLPGPKIRLGVLEKEPVYLKRGQKFVLTTRSVLGNENIAPVYWPELLKVVKKGSLIYVADGLIQLQVEEIKDQDVICTVVVGGELRSRKGINFPGVDLGVCAFTPKDKEILAFALEHGVDAVSQSFVGCAQDVLAVRKAASDLGYNPFIIAKIERAQALEHIDEILEVADGIMIARGDLGVEIPLERIAIVQKSLIQKALTYGKPVITATQMLESMTHNKRPTRAEATDVANAILDGTDAVMLSEESATGKYPVEATKMLAKIAAATEPFLERERFFNMVCVKPQKPRSIVDLVSESIHNIVKNMDIATVFCPTESGTTARKVSRFRLPCWILGVSNHEKTCQELIFSFGVWPVYYGKKPLHWEKTVSKFIDQYAFQGDAILLIEGPSRVHPTVPHRIEIIPLSPGL